MYSSKRTRLKHAALALSAALSIFLTGANDVAAKDAHDALVENLKRLDELLPRIPDAERDDILADVAIQYMWIGDLRTSVARANAIRDEGLRWFALQQIVKQLLAQNRIDEAAACAREHIGGPQHL